MTFPFPEILNLLLQFSPPPSAILPSKRLEKNLDFNVEFDNLQFLKNIEKNHHSGTISSVFIRFSVLVKIHEKQRKVISVVVRAGAGVRG